MVDHMLWKFGFFMSVLVTLVSSLVMRKKLFLQLYKSNENVDVNHSVMKECIMVSVIYVYACSLFVAISFCELYTS